MGGLGQRHLEAGGHIAFIVMCVVVAAAGIRYLVTSAGPSPGWPDRTAIAPGTQLELAADLQAPEARGSLILALSTNCQFCTKSMPFYRRLAGLEVVRSGGLRLGVVSFQPADRMRGYLGQHRLAIDRIVLLPESGLTVEATPTLVLVDNSGVVVDSWRGFLDPELEQRVISAVTALVGG